MNLKNLFNEWAKSSLGQRAWQNNNDNLIKHTADQRTAAGEFFNGKRGWLDLEGQENVPFSGATSPIRNSYQTGVLSNSYAANDVFDLTFHLRHLMAKDGTNEKYLHIHAGISAGSTASGNNLVITCTLGYTKLYSSGRDMSVITPITKTLTATPAELNAAAGNHILVGGDTLIAQNGGGANLFNSSVTNDSTEIWLPDDLLLASCTVTTVPTVTGGSSSRIFIFRKDVHEEVLFGGSPKRIATNNSFWNS